MEDNDEKEAVKKYDINEDEKFLKIICINPTCLKRWYLQTPKTALPVSCINCGSQWVFRR